MDFLGIGPWEILLVLVIALIVLGPGRLPEIARTLGKTVRAIRRASAELTTAVSRELEAPQKETTRPQKTAPPPATGATPATAQTSRPDGDDQPKPGGASAAND